MEISLICFSFILLHFVHLLVSKTCGSWTKSTNVKVMFKTDTSLIYLSNAWFSNDNLLCVSLLCGWLKLLFLMLVLKINDDYKVKLDSSLSLKDRWHVCNSLVFLSLKLQFFHANCVYICLGIMASFEIANFSLIARPTEQKQ